MTTKNNISDYHSQSLHEQFPDNHSSKATKSKGFSLIEVVIAMALVGLTLLGLAQLFTYSVMNNSRADRITNATFLAQQQIDFLRNLTAEELNILTLNPIDETIDTNNDGTIDFRRITQVEQSGLSYNVRVLVYPRTQLAESVNELIQNPGNYRDKADISTVISR